MDKNQGVLEHRFHSFRIGNKVGREVAAVKLHTFDYVERGFERSSLFNGDYAVLADLGHCFGDELADVGVAVSRDGADLSDRIALHRLRQTLNLFDRLLHGLVDSALQGHWAGARGNGLHAFAEDCLGQYGSRGGAVAGDVGGLGSNLADHLGARVLQLVFELDFLRDGYAVLGDGGRSELLLNYYVATLGAKRHFDCVGQAVDTRQKIAARLFAVCNVFSHILPLLVKDSLLALAFCFGDLGPLDYAEDVVLSHNQVLFVVQFDLVAGVLAEEDPVTFLDIQRDVLA